ncbi:2Fe-2S iron-sulfur cluster binding domain-containing protein [Solimonas soli]|uniref:2Fe-2S iron-sulfur cluster binding domain-containing protein n=1 Tax=Solimonas soli TaxID=413479 RepID=UPI000A06CF7E
MESGSSGGDSIEVAETGKVCRVLIRDTGETVRCTDEQSVLAGMEQLGRKGIPVGCRGGGCGVCKVRVLNGHFRTGRMSRAHVTHEEETHGYVLACRLYPQTDLELQVIGKMLRAVTSVTRQANDGSVPRGTDTDTK